MKEEITVGALARVLQKRADRLLNEMTDAEILLVQRGLRGMNREEWLAQRAKLAPTAVEVIALVPLEARRALASEGLEASALVKLTAWQLCNQLALLLSELDSLPESRPPLPVLIPERLAAEAVLSLLACERAAALWPFESESPFRD